MRRLFFISTSLFATLSDKCRLLDYWKKKKDNNNKKKRKKRENLGAGSGDVPGGFFQGNDQFCPTLNETPCEACLFVVLLGGCLINQVTSHFECFLRKPRLNQS